MINTIARHRRDQENGEGGFTLIELLVVVVIIGILTAIAVPLYLNYRKGANDKAAQSDLRAAISTFEQCSTDGGTYPTAAFTIASAANSQSVPAGSCTAQKINASPRTQIKYWPNSATPTAYIVTSMSSAGTGATFYCYNSEVSGSVKKITADKTGYANAC